MQQTRLDRWLKEKFVHETHVLTLSEPPFVPRGVKLEEQQVTISNRFKYRMVIRDRRQLEATLQALADTNQTFSTKVEARRTVLRRFFDDSQGGSFTWRLVGYVFWIIVVFIAIYYIPWNQAYRLREAFDFLRQYT